MLTRATPGPHGTCHARRLATGPRDCRRQRAGLFGLVAKPRAGRSPRRGPLCQRHSAEEARVRAVSKDYNLDQAKIRTMLQAT